jgi:hypothetical protein
VQRYHHHHLDDDTPPITGLLYNDRRAQDGARLPLLSAASTASDAPAMGSGGRIGVPLRGIGFLGKLPQGLKLCAHLC